jgi:hypothetical protein
MAFRVNQMAYSDPWHVTFSSRITFTIYAILSPLAHPPAKAPGEMRLTQGCKPAVKVA